MTAPDTRTPTAEESRTLPTRMDSDLLNQRLNAGEGISHNTLVRHFRAALDREAELQVERDAAVEWAEKAEAERDAALAEVERLRGRDEAAEKMAETLRALTGEDVFLDREYLSQSLNGLLDEACSALAAWDASREGGK